MINCTNCKILNIVDEIATFSIIFLKENGSYVHFMYTVDPYQPEVSRREDFFYNKSVLERSLTTCLGWYIKGRVLFIFGPG